MGIRPQDMPQSSNSLLLSTHSIVEYQYDINSELNVQLEDQETIEIQHVVSN